MIMINILLQNGVKVCPKISGVYVQSKIQVSLTNRARAISRSYLADLIKVLR